MVMRYNTRFVVMYSCMCCMCVLVVVSFPFLSFRCVSTQLQSAPSTSWCLSLSESDVGETHVYIQSQQNLTEHIQKVSNNNNVKNKHTWRLRDTACDETRHARTQRMQMDMVYVLVCVCHIHMSTVLCSLSIC